MGKAIKSVGNFFTKYVPAAQKVRESYKCGKKIFTVVKGFLSLGDNKVDERNLQEIRKMRNEVICLNDQKPLVCNVLHLVFKTQI